jgi:hypothetical protein
VFGVEVIGDGDHFATFTEVDAVVPLVLAHLGRDDVREAIVETSGA